MCVSVCVCVCVCVCAGACMPTCMCACGVLGEGWWWQDGRGNEGTAGREASMSCIEWKLIPAV